MPLSLYHARRLKGLCPRCGRLRAVGRADCGRHPPRLQARSAPPAVGRQALPEHAHRRSLGSTREAVPTLAGFPSSHLQEGLLRVLADLPDGLRVVQCCEVLRPRPPYKAVYHAMRALETQGLVVRLSYGRYARVRRTAAS